MKRINFIIVCIVVFETIVFAQTPPSMKSLLGDGIFFQCGLGYLALHDEYISKEKYSGSLSYFEGGWLKSHDSSAVRFGLEYRSSSTIRNNNVSAKVIQSGVELDYIYFIGKFRLIARDVFAFLGPSMEMHYYDRTENIARGLGGFYRSYARYYALNVNSTFILPIGSEFSAEGSAMLNLAGFGERSSLSQNQTKFISIVSGISGYANILLHYDLSETFLLKAGYRFEICQLTSWDYLLSASDNLIFVVVYRI